MFNFIGLLANGNAANTVDPLYDAISTVGPYAIAICAVLLIFYGIILGVKFARAEDSKERKALQTALINGLIGILAVLVLIVILYAIRRPLVDWMNS